MQPTKCAQRIAAAVFVLCAASPARSTEVAACTDLGPFTIELFAEEAPQHVASFLGYVEQGFYSGTVFHRVVAGFIVQGGARDRMLRVRATRDALPNESHNGLSNTRGTIATFWRANDPNPVASASQFYINLADNTRLDDSEADYSYTVFGRVTSGMETLDAIGRLPTENEVPEPLVAVRSMAVLDRAALEALAEESRTETIKLEIANADAVDDSAGVLEWVRLYRASCAPADPDVLLSEANAALSSSDVERARYVLDDYFAITDASHPGYGRAMSLAETLALTAPPVPRADAVFAHCEVPVMPPLPNGAVDSRAVMEERRNAVSAFIGASDIYLDCLEEVGETQELSELQDALAAEAHNQMVAHVDELVEGFNEQVRIFKAREE
ncbi:MAG TPA: peptidylprolyl isomerase [Gammaproteobacteria bacterium]|jgi:peptidyl-prolyl cis-trans isomerase A (cyclophilin A)